MIDHMTYKQLLSMFFEAELQKVVENDDATGFGLMAIEGDYRPRDGDILFFDSNGDYEPHAMQWIANDLLFIWDEADNSFHVPEYTLYQRDHGAWPTSRGFNEYAALRLHNEWCDRRRKREAGEE